MKFVLPFIIARVYSTLTLLSASVFLVCGVLFSFSFPPFQVADEDLHWVNANEWSERWIATLTRREPMVCSVGAVLPTAFQVEPTKNSLSAKQPQGELTHVSSLKPACHGRPPITIGSVFSYPGVFLARLVVQNENYEGTAALYSFITARIIQGLCVWMVLMRLWWKLRSSESGIIPGALSLGVFCLGPMFINQSFGVTYDMVTLLFSLAAATWFVCGLYVTWMDLALLLCSGAIACSTKPVFLPIGLAVLLVHVVHRHMFRRQSGFVSGDGRWLGGLAACTLVFCVAAIVTTLNDFSDIKDFFKNDPSIDPAYNKAFLFEDKLRALAFLWGSIKGYLHLYVIASPLGWLNVSVGGRAFSLWVHSLKGVLVADGIVALCVLVNSVRMERDVIRRALRGISGGLIPLASVASLAFATAVALYIRWTPRGLLGVQGLQPRYFLPVFLVAISALFCAINSAAASCSSSNQAAPSGSSLVSIVPMVVCLLALLLVAIPYVVALNLDVMVRFF